MVIEQMSISVERGKCLELRSALASLTAPTRAQTGCLSCRLLQSWQEPEEIVLQTKWATLEDLVFYLRSDSYKRLLLLIELSPKPPSIEFYLVQKIRGLDLVESARVAIT